MSKYSAVQYGVCVCVSFLFTLGRVYYLHSENYTLDKANMSWAWNISNSTYNETMHEHMTILINVLVSERCLRHHKLYMSSGYATVHLLGLWHLEAFFTRASNFSWQSSSSQSVNNFTSVQRQEANCTTHVDSKWKPVALGVIGSLCFFMLIFMCCCCPCICMKPSW